METTILTVDYSMTLEEMITAGNYDYCNGDVSTQWFTLSGIGKTAFEYKLFQFEGGESSSDRVIKMIIEAGFFPAKIEHLLAFGATLPEEQRKHKIVAMGSVADVGRRFTVAYLNGENSRRSVELPFGNFYISWGETTKFLGVREIQPKS